MENLLNLLIELIKFDMNQIQRYREVIINLSIISIGASCAISAFLYCRDYEVNNITTKRSILLLTHGAILGIMLIIAYYYIQALNMSRAALEMREYAIQEYINNKTITFTSLYPDTTGFQVKLKSTLEKMPLYLTIIIITIKTIIEYILIPSNKCSKGK